MSKIGCSCAGKSSLGYRSYGFSFPKAGRVRANIAHLLIVSPALPLFLSYPRLSMSFCQCFLFEGSRWSYSNFGIKYNFESIYEQSMLPYNNGKSDMLQWSG